MGMEMRQSVFLLALVMKIRNESVGSCTLPIQGNERSQSTLISTNEKVESSIIQIEDHGDEKDLDSGFKYFEKGDYSSAFKVFEKAAIDGDAIGQMCLSFMYDNGFGVTQDESKAYDLFLKSICNKNLPGDCMKMLSLFEKLAEQGNETAQRKLGVIYAVGIGVAKDVSKGMKWLQTLIEKGNSMAQCYLGEMYERGKGVAQDYFKAFECYEKSTEKGYSVAQNNLGLMYEEGKGVDQNYLKAIECYEKSSKQGNSSAQYNLGEMYFEGKGVEQDYEKALEWCEKSAKQGNSMAQCTLGLMYEEGKGAEQDYFKAFEWYLKSAEQDNSFSKSELGPLYGEGESVFFKELASQGHGDAQFCLGAIYALGQGVDVSFSSSFSWIKKSAKNGNVYAIQFLKENGIKKSLDISHSLTQLENIFNSAISNIKKQE